jgi:hypothetical protein
MRTRAPIRRLVLSNPSLAVFAMNTPKSKLPRRYSSRRTTEITTPDGKYSSGIWDEKFVSLYGQIVAYWSHVEDWMIEVLRDLLGGGPQVPARQVFRSIISNQARKTMMLTLLERARINEHKSALYDQLIRDFSDLNTRRNTYVHGIWHTHESGVVWLCEESIDDFHHLDAREVKKKELEEMWKLMTALVTKIVHRHRPQTIPPTSPETHLQQPVWRNKKAHRALQTKGAKP